MSLFLKHVAGKSMFGLEYLLRPVEERFKLGEERGNSPKTRELQALGHTVRLMPPVYVKPSVKR